MNDTEMAADGGTAPALATADVRNREPNPFTYEGYMLDELIGLAPKRAAEAIARPTADSAKDLCRLSREMWDCFYERSKMDGARAYREAYFATQENLRGRVQAIRDSLSDETRAEATDSLDSITERIGDARLLVTEGFGPLGKMLQDRVLHLTCDDSAPVSV